jgi:Transposase DDE domain group 1
VFNQFGDLERCSLRPSKVNSADVWDAVLNPFVARYQGKVSHIYFRADAGFANPEVYEFLEAERTGSCRILIAKQGFFHDYTSSSYGAIIP